MESKTIHEWLYDIAKEICYDREYIYLSYLKILQNTVFSVFENGSVTEQGDYIAKGIKSDKDAHIHWKLHHRLNFVGFNKVIFECTFQDKYTHECMDTVSCSFELSSGERIV